MAIIGREIIRHRRIMERESPAIYSSTSLSQEAAKMLVEARRNGDNETIKILEQIIEEQRYVSLKGKGK